MLVLVWVGVTVDLFVVLIVSCVRFDVAAVGLGCIICAGSGAGVRCGCWDFCGFWFRLLWWIFAELMLDWFGGLCL